MGLIVAFGEDTAAKGELFWDDGESIGQILAVISVLIPEKNIVILELKNTYLWKKSSQNSC